MVKMMIDDDETNLREYRYMGVTR